MALANCRSAGKPAMFELSVAQNFQAITGSVMVGGNAWRSRTRG